MIDRAENCKGLLTEFIPCPEELTDDELTTSYGDDEKQKVVDSKRAAMLAKYGYASWYDWNIANWGVKWDFELENVERVDANTLSAAFDSAWSPPIEAYQKLEELGFTVDAMYYEPGMAFCGTYDAEFGDSTIDLSDYTAETVRDAIGEELDDCFGISEEMAQYDEDEE